MIPILYLSHCGSSIGGGEKQLYYLVTHLDRKNFQPIVVCPDDGIFAEQLREAEIPTVILNLPSWRKVRSRLTRRSAAAKLTDLAKEHDITIGAYLRFVAKSIYVASKKPIGHSYCFACA